MKFARYLEDNCTPEWKRAYIDYRRLKKQIKLIQSRQSLPSLPDGRNPSSSQGPFAGDVATSGDERHHPGLSDLDELDSSDRDDLGPVAGFRPTRGQTRPASGAGQQRAEGPGEDGDRGETGQAGTGAGRKWWNRLDLPRAIESTNMQASRSDERVHEAVVRVGGGGGDERREDEQGDQGPPTTTPTTTKERQRQRSVSGEGSSSAASASGPTGGRGYGSMGTSPALRACRSGSGSGSGSGAGGKRVGLGSQQREQQPSRPCSRSGTPRESAGGASSSSGNNLKMTRSRSRSSMIPPELRLPDSSLDTNDDDDDESGGDLGLGSSASPNRGMENAHGQEKEDGSEKRSSSASTSSRLAVPASSALGLRDQDQTRGISLDRSESRTTTAADSSSGDEDGNVVSRPPVAIGGGTGHLHHIKSLATRSPRLDSVTGPGRSPRLAGSSTDGNGGIVGMFKSPSMRARVGIPEGGGERTMSSRTLKASPSGNSINPRRLGVPPARFPETLQELYDIASPEELRFLQTLDNELEKVESFYHDRESDALKRSHELKRQLDELAEHRRVFHEAEEERMNEGKVKRYIDGAVGGVQKRIPFVSSVIQIADPRAQNAGNQVAQHSAVGKRPGETDSSDNGKEDGSITKHTTSKPSNGSGVARNRTPMNGRASFDPEKYQRYKKKLRTAILEFYKELEILKNYRILNITGFKKALKKFEKTARIKCIDLYMDGKVSKRSFADGQTIDRMLKQMEDEFTLRFEKGDHKKAVGRLRGQFVTKTHHLSTFSSGTYIGVGVPLMILGLTEALHDETRLRFPQVEALLLVYSALFLPVLFGMLFELNLAAFVASRINYGFIMELDIRTAIDHRQFLEIPAMLFVALSICFYFSVHQIGEPAISPYAWPVVWIVGVITFFLNPIPVYFQHARYWLLSVLGRVLTPGYSRVEFIAFFVADELNSLTYTIGHLWTIGCAYNRHWPADTLSICRTSGSWVYGLLVCVPAFIRFVQCMKRFKDSRLKIHLINAGKYVSSMLQLAMFTYWRSRGSSLHDHSFAIWATSATLASTYTSAWDLSIDWGLLRPHAGYLRESLGYPTIKPYYYVAMVSNVIVRFIWVWYIPKSTTDVPLKSFIFATMEMLRRWQWNFFRVETEQVGNTDQYRVTREVPLPYRMIQDDEDDDDEDSLSRKRSRQKANGLGLRSAALALGQWREHMLSARARKRQPDRNANAGPRGDDAHRDYSPRQNNDMVIPVASPDRISGHSEDGLITEQGGRVSPERAAGRTL